MLKVKVVENPNIEEVEVQITCPSHNEQVDKIIKVLSNSFVNITGKKDGYTHVLNLDDIFYFEAVDNHVFAYLEKDVYEVSYKLQELSEMLSQTFFIQTSRTLITNIQKINKVSTLVNGRILAVLSNGEKMIITRVYAQKFKQKLKE